MRVVAFLLALSLSAMPAIPQTSNGATSIRVPIENSLPGGLLAHPCGTGDLIRFSGDMHIVTHTTRDAAGGFHYKVEVVEQNITGVGLISGAQYRLVRASNIFRQETNGAYITAEVNATNHLIAKAPGEDFWVHSSAHMTFDASGRLVTSTVAFRASCEIIS